MEINLLTPPDLEKFEHLFPPYLLKELRADEILLGSVNEEPLEAAGILMAHPEEGELFVDWIYVDEPYREKGAGRAMLELLVDTAEESGRIDGVTLVFSQYQKNLDVFLRACDFAVFQREGDRGFLTTLGKFPRFPISGAPIGEILPLPKVGQNALRWFSDLLSDAAVPGVAVEIPFEVNRYLPESCVLLEDGRIRGLCLLEKNDKGISIAWIYNYCSSPDAIIHVMNESMRLLKENYPADMGLSFASVNPAIEGIIERRIPVASRAEIYVGTYRFDL